MRCGNCREQHDTVDEVKSCYNINGATKRPIAGEESVWPPSEKQVKYVLGLQEQRMLPAWWKTYDADTLARLDRDEVSGLINQLKGFQFKVDSEHREVPAGRYALLGQTSLGPTWRFYEVQDGKNRWKGYKFIKRLVGSPGDYQKSPVGREERAAIMKLIEADPQKAAIDYGHQSGCCSMCGSPLTNPESLAAGIGPVCAGKRGW